MANVSTKFCISCCRCVSKSTGIKFANAEFRQEICSSIILLILSGNPSATEYITATVYLQFSISRSKCVSKSTQVMFVNGEFAFRICSSIILLIFPGSPLVIEYITVTIYFQFLILHSTSVIKSLSKLSEC